jgi:hypothetical protein
VCDSVTQRISQHSDDLMTCDNMQMFVETLDASCELQKIVLDICEPTASTLPPSALDAFWAGKGGDDMFETWM